MTEVHRIDVRPFGERSWSVSFGSERSRSASAFEMVPSPLASSPREANLAEKPWSPTRQDRKLGLLRDPDVRQASE